MSVIYEESRTIGLREPVAGLRVMGRTLPTPLINVATRRKLGFRALLVVCALQIAITGVGCSGSSGPQRFDVSGTVKLDDKLVPKGVLTLVPTGGTQGPSAGSEIVDGKFHIPKIKGPVAGEYTFQFTGASDIPSGEYVVIRGNIKEALMVPVFPDKYGLASTETRKIGPDSTKFDFELSSK